MGQVTHHHCTVHVQGLVSVSDHNKVSTSQITSALDNHAIQATQKTGEVRWYVYVGESVVRGERGWMWVGWCYANS